MPILLCEGNDQAATHNPTLHVDRILAMFRHEYQVVALSVQGWYFIPCNNILFYLWFPPPSPYRDPMVVTVCTYRTYSLFGCLNSNWTQKHWTNQQIQRRSVCASVMMIKSVIQCVSSGQSHSCLGSIDYTE